MDETKYGWIAFAALILIAAWLLRVRKRPFRRVLRRRRPGTLLEPTPDLGGGGDGAGFDGFWDAGHGDHDGGSGGGDGGDGGDGGSD